MSSRNKNGKRLHIIMVGNNLNFILSSLLVAGVCFVTTRPSSRPVFPIHYANYHWLDARGAWQCLWGSSWWARPWQIEFVLCEAETFGCDDLLYGFFWAPPMLPWRCSRDMLASASPISMRRLAGSPEPEVGSGFWLFSEGPQDHSNGLEWSIWV